MFDVSAETDEKDETADYLLVPSTSNHHNPHLGGKFLSINDDNFIDLNYSEEESGDEEKHVKLETKFMNSQIITAEKVEYMNFLYMIFFFLGY